MRARVHSRLALRTLINLQWCGEARFARKWTGWKPRIKTPENTFSNQHSTVRRTLGNAASGRNDLERHGVPFPRSKQRGPAFSVRTFLPELIGQAADLESRCPPCVLATAAVATCR